MLYEPREDSYFLQDFVNKYSRGVVLDMGTGSGIQAITAAKKGCRVVASDIQASAIKAATENAAAEGVDIEFVKGDLFSRVPRMKFETVIFNPPYLPQDKNIRDPSLYGGKRGYETIERFFSELGYYLAEDGIVLFVFSSITGRYNVDGILKKYLFESEILGVKTIFFEDIYVYLARKSAVLQTLEYRGITRPENFARGKRGIILVGEYMGNKVAIKIRNPESRALLRMENEARWLKMLNEYGIGPLYVFSGEDFLVYRFAEGMLVEEFLARGSRRQRLSVITDLLEQLFTMDSIRVNKEEMHHPVKHIIIGKRPIMIDFERCHYTQRPKNVSQFCQYIMKIAGKQDPGFMEVVRAYKAGLGKADFSRIIKYLKSNLL
ncbi:MAG: HemK2/MTQ2 family protein methyltransferase [archaeon]